MAASDLASTDSTAAARSDLVAAQRRVGWRAAKLEQRGDATAPVAGARARAGQQRSLDRSERQFRRPDRARQRGARAGRQHLSARYRDKAQLKRFDPCECRFQTVPCFGGEGGGPRQLNDPHGIGICAGNLFVCDTGNHRAERVCPARLRAARPLAAACPRLPMADPHLINRGNPTMLAFDRRGSVYVTDGANGCIHRFSSVGTVGDVLRRIRCRSPGSRLIAATAFTSLSKAPPRPSRRQSGRQSVVVASSPEELTPLFPRTSVCGGCRRLAASRPALCRAIRRSCRSRRRAQVPAGSDAGARRLRSARQSPSGASTPDHAELCHSGHLLSARRSTASCTAASGIASFCAARFPPASRLIGLNLHGRSAC